MSSSAAAPTDATAFPKMDQTSSSLSSVAISPSNKNNNNNNNNNNDASNTTTTKTTATLEDGQIGSPTTTTKSAKVFTTPTPQGVVNAMMLHREGDGNTIEEEEGLEVPFDATLFAAAAAAAVAKEELPGTPPTGSSSPVRSTQKIAKPQQPLQTTPPKQQPPLPQSPPAAATTTATTTNVKDHTDDELLDDEDPKHSNHPEHAMKLVTHSLSLFLADPSLAHLEQLLRQLWSHCFVPSTNSDDDHHHPEPWGWTQWSIVGFVLWLSVSTSWGLAVWHQGWLLVLRSVAWAIGIAIGLGWSAHVYEQLDLWQAQQDEQDALKLDAHNNNNKNYNNNNNDMELDSSSHHRRHSATTPTQQQSQQANRSHSFVSAASSSMSAAAEHHAGNALSSSPRPSVSSPTSAAAAAAATASSIMASHNNHNNNNHAAPILQDEQTYASLMQAAGYPVATVTNPNQGGCFLRGQVLRRPPPPPTTTTEPEGGRSNNNSNTTLTSSWWPDRYRLEHGTTALEAMRDLWGPQSPHPRIQAALSHFMEYLMRDFIVSWYALVDKGVVYQRPNDTHHHHDDEEENGNNNHQNQGNGGDQKKESTDASSSSHFENNNYSNDPTTGDNPASKVGERSWSSSTIYTRAMIYSTARQRSIPFLDQLYHSMALIFGNLATRVESLNVLELVLMKWTRVLAHTFRVYRQLRRRLLLQQPPPPPATSASKTSTSASSTVHGSDHGANHKNQSTTTTTTTTRTTTSPTNNAQGGGATASSSGSRASSAPRRQRPITEMAMTREFLLAGKLHRAMTFGVDVPSLLFADATGRECGIDIDPSLQSAAQAQRYAEVQQQQQQQQQATAAAKTDANNNKNATPRRRQPTPDDVLEQRLFDTPLLRECELDYNRVLGHRMVRALASRVDTSSPLIATLLTELFASCVLSPIMSLFGPDYINGWILQGLGDGTKQQDDNNKQAETSKKKPPPSSDPAKKEQSATAKASLLKKKRASSTTESPSSDQNHNRKSGLRKRHGGDAKSSKSTSGLVASSEPVSPQRQGQVQEQLPLASVQEGRTLSPMASPTPKPLMCMDRSASSFDGSSTAGLTTELEDDYDVGDEDDNNNNDDDDDDKDVLLHALSVALMDMRRFMDFDQLRVRSSPRSQQYHHHGTVDTVEWDDPDCRAAVLRLVLILEATLSDGRCVYRTANQLPSEHNQQRDEEDEDEDANATTPTKVKEEDDEDENNNSVAELQRGPLRTMASNADSTTADDMENDIVVDDSLADDPAADYHEDDSIITLPQLLMEMTGDVEAFEERVATENSVLMAKESTGEYTDDRIAEPYTLPSATEQSTLRTLIAAWLHTGQIHRIMTVIVQAHATILSPYYSKSAFLRSLSKTSRLVRELQVLDQVDVLVDTMEVLASPPLPLVTRKKVVKKTLPSPRTISSITEEDGETSRISTLTIPEQEEQVIVPLVAQQHQPSSPSSSSQLLLSSATVPRHFDYHRNEAFAASLRAERERRMQSWYAHCGFDPHQPSAEDELASMFVSRGSPDSAETHRHFELHQIARIFYNSTNLIAIRDATRRKNAPSITASLNALGGNPSQQQGATVDGVEEALLQVRPSTDEEDLQWVSLLTVETACPRRRIEVPDDDSSFLLRAQARPLQAVGVHRDQRNHDQSFKCFAASYEEPALGGSDHYSGGRYIRMCLVRYYPIDRTAAIFPPQQQDLRSRLDQRRSGNPSSVPALITLDTSSTASNRPQPTPLLSPDFLRERHICHRWIPRGTSRTHSMLASNVMEPSDFTAQPRTGKAMDFVYRMSLFEKPMIELRNKKFTVHDSSAARNTHRADASSMEISDASLSAALYMLGESLSAALYMLGESKSLSRGVGGQSSIVQMGEDGYPIIWMKFSKQGNETEVEVKPYRLSFVRAALLVTAARQEAQLQSLIACVKVGSAKNATKALTDARLKPTLRLLYHANHKSREKQSLLLRDLKLGINHVDREQLRRNGLLNPRYPTQIKDLTVCVEDALFAEDVHDANLFGTTGTVYKIKCTATVQLIHDYNDPVDKECYGEHARSFSEEWVVYRSFKEFQALHRHLKNMVSSSESSGTAVTRLSASIHGAANPSAIPKRHRSALVPSLSQASKIGTLGLTKKSMQKRKEHLDSYLSYLFAPNHLLNRCTELLLFVGAFYPLPPAVKLDVCVTGLPDPLGRTRMKRTIIEEEEPADDHKGQDAPTTVVDRAANNGTADDDDAAAEDTKETQLRKARKKTAIQMIPAIRHKIDKVPLSQVRNRVFELLRYQFGFDNASFMRNRMLAGLKTASFAVTSASDFRRMLYNWHTKNLSTSAVADWIDVGTNLLWPDGVFLQSGSPLTSEQLADQAKKSKIALHNGFPDALRAILGQELTRDGLNIVHEMLQNRVVVRSMAYMLFDLLWVEVFPEIGDVLQGGAALDIDK